MTNIDLQRDFGRMEGNISSVCTRLDKIEKLLERMDDRLAQIEALESQRRGAWRTLVALASVIGGAAGWLLSKWVH